VASLIIEGIVISLKILVIEMGDRGSKSVYITVKEQRVDGSSIYVYIYIVRCTIVAGKSGS